MKRLNLTEISQSTALPLEAISDSFQELLKKGWIFTKAKNAEEMNNSKYPFRLASVPPFKKTGVSSLSLGPFCLDKKTYESLYFQAKNELSDIEAWKLLLVFKRIQFEKLGITSNEYQFRLNDKPMSMMLSLIDCWNIEEPIIFDSFVWIEPNSKAKELAEKMGGKTFAENDFSWWNIMIDFGKEFEPSLPVDYPSEFTYFPDTLRYWQKYLPLEFYFLILELCHKLGTGKEFEYKTVKSSSDLMKIIQNFFEKAKEYPKDKGTHSLDKGVLLKELYDYNSFSYPFDSNSAFDLLLQIGFIKMKKVGVTVEYHLNKNPPKPKRLIKFPIKWESRMGEFLKTGSILFAYLTVEEILSE